MDSVYGLVALAGILGVFGFAGGWLVGAVVARRARAVSRAGWVAAGWWAAIVLGLGIALAAKVPLEPKNAADARAHDYSLAALDVLAWLWVGAVNAVSGVLGIRLALQWARLQAAMAEELRSASADPPSG